MRSSRTVRQASALSAPTLDRQQDLLAVRAHADETSAASVRR